MSLNNYLDNHKIISQILNKTNEDNYNLNVNELSSNGDLFLIETLNKKHNNENIIVVYPTIYKAEKAYNKLSNLDNSFFYPADNFINEEFLTINNDFKYQRINTILKSKENTNNIIFTNIDAFSRKHMSKEVWDNSVLQYKIGDVIDLNKITETLIMYGYKKVYNVEKFGEFSIRGSIIDICGMDLKPYRIDLFDDEIDIIKVFDLETQMSIENIEQVIISPMGDIFFSSDDILAIIEYLKKIKTKDNEDYIDKELINAETRENPSKLYKYLSILNINNTFLDLFDSKIVYYANYIETTHKYKEMMTSQYEWSINNKVPTDIKFINSDIDLLSKSNKNIFSMFHVKRYDNVNYDLSINLSTRDILEVPMLQKYIEDYKGTIVINLTSTSSRKKVINLFERYEVTYNLISEKDNIVKGEVNVIINNSKLSFELIQDKISVLSESSIFYKEKVNKPKYKSIFEEEERIRSTDDILPGDYIVHIDYGIGQYIGIKTVELDGLKGDYITLLYKNNDSLHIPVVNINLLSKYVAGEGRKPKLNKLGGSEWAKTKSKVRNKVKTLAFDLIKVYAERESKKGFAHRIDCDDQILFENDFEYTATKDQLKAVQDVKKDMESENPMDRLICGDVGYGKTEIAMRAAFKSVMNEKQVLYLAPTTVLSNQTYKLFKNRFEKYGLRVELVNRFVTQKEQKKIIEGLEKGYIDVVIGTHRLLNSVFIYKDLGLLIVDEEQRFGVEHKEKIKLIKSNVDILTLTATPIPRTLQMSIMNVKQISTLNTPPKNRYPIQTYVLDFNTSVIKNAIESELSRDGQVFILYNKTSDIDLFSNKIAKLVPTAKISYAHGQMNKNKLEETIQDFINKEYDILVCTTIIETGIDIPNANTIIINDADKFGLSQLYQIRGRVGRSEKVAYAYLMYSQNKTIKPEAAERLKAIREFTELGSGFNIAKRDLSIRGAGDVLGAEQSGFIDGVGVKLYTAMLEEEIAKIKNKTEELKVESEKVVGFNIGTHISNEYIVDESTRINIHRKIDNIKKPSDIVKLVKELTDRFGRVNKDIILYMNEKLLDFYIEKFLIKSVNKTRNNILIKISKEGSQLIDGTLLFKIISSYDDLIEITYKNKLILISFNLKDFKDHYIVVLNKIFNKLK